MKTMKKNFPVGFIILLSCLFLTVLPVKNASAKTTEGTYRYDLAWELFDCLNQTRVSVGLPKLKQDQYLTDIAMTRAAELAVNCSHYRPDGSYFTSAGDSRLKLENIAWGYKTSKEVNTALVNSPSHYKNMTTTSCSAVGIGCFEAADGTLYWTEDFGSYTSAAVKKSNQSTISAKGKKANITSIENLASGIRIKWDKVDYVSGYYIYRKAGSGSWKLIKNIKKYSTTKYKDTSVKSNSGKKYSYKVIPYTKSDGKTGSGTQASIYRVARPTGLKLTSSGGNIVVKWKKVPKATEYEIDISESPTFSTRYWFNHTSNTKYTYKSHGNLNGLELEVGKTYYVRLRTCFKKNGKEYLSACTKTAQIKVKK